MLTGMKSPSSPSASAAACGSGIPFGHETTPSFHATRNMFCIARPTSTGKSPPSVATATANALVQTLPTPLDRAQELVEVDLERREDRVGPILHLEPRLASLAPRVVDDVGGLALGQLDDLGLGRFPDGLLASLAQNAVALALCLG